MKKDYQKPEAELISLVAEEQIASELGEGDQTLESGWFN